MRKLVGTAAVVLFIVHVSRAAEAHEPSDRVLPRGGGALMESMAAAAEEGDGAPGAEITAGFNEAPARFADTHGVSEAASWPGLPTSISAAFSQDDMDHGLLVPAKRKTRKAAVGSPESTFQPRRGTRALRSATPAARRESRAAAANDGNPARERGSHVRARSSQMRAFSPTHALDASIQRATSALAADLRRGVSPFSEPRNVAFPADRDRSESTADTVSFASLGGGPLMVTLDLTEMYGSEQWIRPLLVPKYVGMSEPFWHSHGELPRPRASGASARVPVPTSLTLLAAGAVAWFSVRAGVRRIGTMRRNVSTLGDI